AVVACGAVGRSGVRAHAGARVARAGDVALIGCRARHGRAAGAHAGLARIDLRAGVAVVATRAVADVAVQALPGHVADVVRAGVAVIAVAIQQAADAHAGAVADFARPAARARGRERMAGNTRGAYLAGARIAVVGRDVAVIAQRRRTATAVAHDLVAVAW